MLDWFLLAAVGNLVLFFYVQYFLISLFMLYVCPIAHSVTSKYLFDKLIKRPFSAKNTTCPHINLLNSC